MYATSRDTFESVIGGFVDVASKWGLTVSIAKTKGMVIGSHCTPTDILPVQLEGGPIEIVQEFTYLGSSISRDGEVKGEVKCRIGKAVADPGFGKGGFHMSGVRQGETSMRAAAKRRRYRA